MARLRVTSGPLSGQTIEVTGVLVIGRDKVDVTIDDAKISRRHAVVRLAADELEVEDLGSSNGTFVDGSRIEGPTRVGGGGEIRLGGTVLEVEGVAGQEARLRQTIADPKITKARGIPADVTRARAIQPATAAPGAEAARPAPVPPVPSARPARSAAPEPSAPIGVFSPPTRAHKRGLVSRSWLPVVLSFGTVIVTAVALVIYFASR